MAKLLALYRPRACVAAVMISILSGCVWAEPSGPSAAPSRPPASASGEETALSSEPAAAGPAVASESSDAAEHSPHTPTASPQRAAGADAVAENPLEEDGWRLLFNGQDLDGWKITRFGGEGEVAVEDGTLVLHTGADLTGVTYTRPTPKINYEVSLEAQRVEGSDFFCGLTFPVKDDPCSLIIGGWGGGVCGLSSLNGMDASENATTYYYPDFKNNTWYRIKLRVTEPKIEAWIDDKQIIDADIANVKISIRPEVELSRPFGLASWQTTAALRNIRIRSIDPLPTSGGAE